MLTKEEQKELDILMKKLASMDITLSKIERDRQIVLIRLEELTNKIETKE